MRLSNSRPVVVLGSPVAPPVGDGSFATVKVEIPPDCQLLAALYGQLKVNPTTTILDRVVTSISWKAEFRRNDSGTDTSDQANLVKIDLAPNGSDGGELTWTQNDGRPLGLVLVPHPGFLIFGAKKTGGGLPGTVTAALSGVRGVLLPRDLPDAELRGLIGALGAW